MLKQTLCFARQLVCILDSLTKSNTRKSQYLNAAYIRVIYSYTLKVLNVVAKTRSANRVLYTYSYLLVILTNNMFV